MDDSEMLQRALIFAKEKHKGQKDTTWLNI